MPYTPHERRENTIAALTALTEDYRGTDVGYGKTAKHVIFSTMPDGADLDAALAVMESARVLATKIFLLSYLTMTGANESKLRSELWDEVAYWRNAQATGMRRQIQQLVEGLADNPPMLPVPARPKTIQVQVTRTVSCYVDVEDCESPNEAVAVVDRDAYELPAAAEWEPMKDSYCYFIDGEEVTVDNPPRLPSPTGPKIIKVRWQTLNTYENTFSVAGDFDHDDSEAVEELIAGIDEDEDDDPGNYVTGIEDPTILEVTWEA